jgi:hypothetical protein
MRAVFLLCLSAWACSGNSTLSVPDGAVANDLSMPAPRDFAVTPMCQCAKGTYCDLATNTCKPGCAFDTDCSAPTTHCDTASHQCVDPSSLCGGKVCNAGEQCCLLGGSPTCATSCVTDMGSVTVMCQGPSDCSSAASPICCAHLTLGAAPGCAYTAQVMCQAACPFQFPVGCPSTGQGALCTAKSDCKDAAAANCCTFMFQGQTGSFCVSDSYTAFAQGCLP